MAHLPFPKGASLVSLPVTPEADVAVYWTRNPVNSTATNAFIMMHGKLRDGANYWGIMNEVLNTAVAEKYPNAFNTSIIAAPQFYSTRFNSGQYTSKQLAFADTNVWQASEAANHPRGCNVTTFDASMRSSPSLAIRQSTPRCNRLLCRPRCRGTGHFEVRNHKCRPTRF